MSQVLILFYFVSPEKEAFKDRGGEWMVEGIYRERKEKGGDVDDVALK